MTDSLLEKLTKRQREVINLRYLVGIRTDRDVGEHLGICRSAVTRRRRRALARLETDANYAELVETIQKRNQIDGIEVEGS